MHHNCVALTLFVLSADLCMFVWSSVISLMAAINRRGDAIHIAAETNSENVQPQHTCTRADSAGEWQVLSKGVWLKTMVITPPVSQCPATHSTVLRATHIECSRSISTAPVFTDNVVVMETLQFG